MKLANHIILIGFMGSGKSTIARRLSRQLGMASIDMDNYIQRASGMSISQIFATKGEVGFRELENAFLKTMPERDRCILSCGGGVVSTEANQILLQQLGWVIYLEVDVTQVKARITNSDSRPLLGDEAAISKLLASRESLYRQVADGYVDTTELSIAEVTNQVVDLLRANGQL